jgi:hypothetical protein
MLFDRGSRRAGHPGTVSPVPIPSNMVLAPIGTLIPPSPLPPPPRPPQLRPARGAHPQPAPGVAVVRGLVQRPVQATGWCCRCCCAGCERAESLAVSLVSPECIYPPGRPAGVCAQGAAGAAGTAVQSHWQQELVDSMISYGTTGTVTVASCRSMCAGCSRSSRHCGAVALATRASIGIRQRVEFCLAPYRSSSCQLTECYSA